MCENYNKSWITVHECRLRAVSRNKTTMHFNVTVHHPVKVQVQMQIFKKANGYKPWLYKINIDVCKFLQKASCNISVQVPKGFFNVQLELSSSGMCTYLS